MEAGVSTDNQLPTPEQMKFAAEELAAARAELDIATERHRDAERTKRAAERRVETAAGIMRKLTDQLAPLPRSGMRVTG